MKGQTIRVPVHRVETAVIKQKPTANKNSAVRGTTGPIQTYKIKPGDSLAGIARQFNVSVDNLKEINKLKSNAIQAGRTLIIPLSCDETGEDKRENREKGNNISASVSKTDMAGKSLTQRDVEQLGTNKHIVTKGDSLFSIAQKYNVDLDKLTKMNHLSASDPIAPGQVLVVK